MKCPHCEYEHGWSNEQDAMVKGKEGDFFHQDALLVRGRDGEQQERKLFACPSCLKTFIGYDWE